MKYKQLNYEQRYSIELMLKTKINKKEIAHFIGISESTLYRELKRNKQKRGSYNSNFAQMLANERKTDQHVKKRLTSDMKKLIKNKLALQWSPDQIRNWCKIKGIDMVSHERIYQYIWQDKSEGGNLFSQLRCMNKKYKRRYHCNKKRGSIANRVMIDKRPKIVDSKQRIGDFEIDLIIGKGHKGAMLTIVDRKTNFTITNPLKSKNAMEVEKAMINAMAPYKEIIQTITSDNGKEFSNHQSIAEKLQADFYFANPYSSWERGANENTNKLIRQYLPKTKDLTTVKNEENLMIMNRLNNRPRKKLGYKSPAEVFYNDIRKLKLALAG